MSSETSSSRMHAAACIILWLTWRCFELHLHCCVVRGTQVTTPDTQHVHVQSSSDRLIDRMERAMQYLWYPWLTPA